MSASSSPIGGSRWECSVCGAVVDVATPLSWRCPRATDDDRRHELRLVQPIVPLRSTGADNPFLGFRRYLAWDMFAAASGFDDAAREALVVELDGHVAAVAGTGFVTTPFARADALSDHLGFTVDGGVWVKDETHNVAGSHKARHLFGILLHLVTAERTGRATWTDASSRPPLAIASCGNAALAASTLAAAVDWPIRVFVPPSANPVVRRRLGELGADVVECPRLASDPPGDPCVHRFREAVAAGAVPFGVQGPENAWCLDGGRTIGWEMARHLEERVEGPPIDRLFVQVGGGALAACLAAGFRMSGITPKLHPVQTDSCAPLARAWQRVGAFGGARAAAAHWEACMWPWEHVGESAADGILDDETYDWIPVLGAVDDSHGEPVVVDERHVLEANELARSLTGIDVSHTGSAGLAGLLATRASVAHDDRVAVVLSGIRR
jgi:threonine synthase